MSRKLIERIFEAQEYARTLSGECLSVDYNSGSSPMKWRCKEGHEWEASFTQTVIQKRWCKLCTPRREKDPKTLEMAKSYAESRGGKCLSEEYQNSTTPLKWVCSEGHEWEANFNGKTWCPQCSYKARGCDNTIRARDKFEAEGWRVLSYSLKEIKVRCPKGHELTKKTFSRCCPVCWEESRVNQDKVFQSAIQLAAFYQGKCLSKKHANKKLLWECSRGHKWYAPLAYIRDGSWCRRCQTIGRMEELTRQLMEYITGKPFDKVRPKWLLSPKGNPMELDGFNVELQLAFEYQGEQHYTVAGQFRKRGAKERLRKTQEYDQLKAQTCLERGIKLIEIPFQIKFLEMENFLRSLVPEELQIPQQESFRFTVPEKPKKVRLRKRKPSLKQVEGEGDGQEEES